MPIHILLSVDRIQLIENTLASRKRVLQALAGMLANPEDKISEQMILNQLLEREKLGSTSLGDSVAVPHCRIPNLPQPCAALLRVVPGIEYDAPDNVPVKLFFALLVPQDAAEEHLQLLANVAKILTQPKVKNDLMETNDATQIISILKNADERTSHFA